jgi:hypothetical protein
MRRQIGDEQIKPLGGIQSERKAEINKIDDLKAALAIFSFGNPGM